MNSGLMIGDELAQHRREAVDGVGGLAVGTGEAAYRVIRAIHLRAAVDQEQRVGIGNRVRMYIIRWMRRSRMRRSGRGRARALIAAACSNPLGRQYEYEEQIYLRVDGAATVVIDASLPALVALRGVPLDVGRGARMDRRDDPRDVRGGRLRRR